MIKSDAEIYGILEELLKAAGDTPQTCVDIYEDSRVKRLVDSPNRVSDYLGHLWRRELIQRWYAPKSSNSRSRYAYTWIEKDESDETQPVERLTIVPSAKKPNITVTESNDEIVIDFKDFTITVKRK